MWTTGTQTTGTVQRGISRLGEYMGDGSRGRRGGFCGIQAIAAGTIKLIVTGCKGERNQSCGQPLSYNETIQCVQYHT
jgi:hypothetical protein